MKKRKDYYGIRKLAKLLSDEFVEILFTLSEKEVENLKLEEYIPYSYKNGLYGQIPSRKGERIKQSLSKDGLLYRVTTQLEVYLANFPESREYVFNLFKGEFRASDIVILRSYFKKTLLERNFSYRNIVH